MTSADGGRSGGSARSAASVSSRSRTPPTRDRRSPLSAPGIGDQSSAESSRLHAARFRPDSVHRISQEIAVRRTGETRVMGDMPPWNEGRDTWNAIYEGTKRQRMFHMEGEKDTE